MGSNMVELCSKGVQLGFDVFDVGVQGAMALLQFISFRLVVGVQFSDGLEMLGRALQNDIELVIFAVAEEFRSLQFCNVVVGFAVLLSSGGLYWLLTHLGVPDCGRRGRSCRYGDERIQGTVSSGHVLGANGDDGGASRRRSFRSHVRSD
jgi:hypothetical protein